MVIPVEVGWKKLDLLLAELGGLLCVPESEVDEREVPVRVFRTVNQSDPLLVVENRPLVEPELLVNLGSVVQTLRVELPKRDQRLVVLQSLKFVTELIHQNSFIE